MPIGITLTESERVGTPTFVSTKLEYLLRKEGYLRYLLWEAKPTRKTGNWKLETGNWKLGELVKLESRNWVNWANWANWATVARRGAAGTARSLYA